MFELKELEVERLNEDLRVLDEDLYDIENQRIELEEKLEKLEEQRIIKDKIIQKQEILLKEKEFRILSCRTSTPNKFDKKIQPKTSRNRYESPTLV